MTSAPCRLDASWQPLDGSNGRLEFTLTNLSADELRDFRLVYTSLTRTLPEHRCDGARLVCRVANFHEYAPPSDFALRPGAAWTFTVEGLNRKARHRTDGATSAYVVLSDESTLAVDVGDLLLKGEPVEPPPALLPPGRLDVPALMLPWPKRCALRFGDAPPPTLHPAPGTGVAELAAMSAVTALARRLFPHEPAPFALTAAPGGTPVSFSMDAGLGAEAYRLDFSADGVVVTSGHAAGRFYGLVTLAQLISGARNPAGRFRFPRSGSIEDAPRHGWRGCHLDVSRQFYPLADVVRFLDILAWHKLNIFHWHLTDDEGWRLEIKSYPELVEIGSKRGHREKMVAQLGSAAETAAGHYSQAEVRHVVAHAASLQIEVVPEIDIPGHCTAVLHALPHLRDPEETPDSYHSIQGYPNNALNPAVEETYVFLDRVFAEMAALFPSPYVHVGGDEVADGSWLKSPRAQALMQEKGLSGTAELQAHFMRRVKAMLTARGKQLAGWDEVSHGGGVDPEGTLLTAWQTAEVGLDLARMGFDVVMAPGQAYYLDMVQDESWMEPGMSWAGTVSPEKTYTYEAAAEFPPELAGRLRGVQGCIWSENMTSKAYFNRLVFPRLSAIAEAAWTPAAGKDWQRFAAIAPFLPRL